MSADFEKKVRELEERIEELEQRMDDGAVIPSQSGLDEFIGSVSPNTHVERATAIAYYLTHEKDESPFVVGDIEQAYVECRLPQPANMSDVLAGAEENGWLMRAGSEGQYQLWNITRDGDDIVNGWFE